MILILHVQSRVHYILRFPWVTNRVHFCDGRWDLSAVEPLENGFQQNQKTSPLCLTRFPKNSSWKNLWKPGLHGRVLLFRRIAASNGPSWGSQTLLHQKFIAYFAFRLCFCLKPTWLCYFLEVVWEPSPSVFSGSNLRQYPSYAFTQHGLAIVSIESKSCFFCSLQHDLPSSSPERWPE